MRLLSLLHARSAFEPEEWAMFDKWHLILAEHFAVLMPEFNGNCVVMQGPEYGKLVPWDEEKAHSWQIMAYCKARQILTAQKRIMQFLRKMVDALVGDQPSVDEPTVSPLLFPETIVSTIISVPTDHFEAQPKLNSSNRVAASKIFWQIQRKICQELRTIDIDLWTLY